MNDHNPLEPLDEDVPAGAESSRGEEDTGNGEPPPPPPNPPKP